MAKNKPKPHDRGMKPSDKARSIAYDARRLKKFESTVAGRAGDAGKMSGLQIVNEIINPYRRYDLDNKESKARKIDDLLLSVREPKSQEARLGLGIRKATKKGTYQKALAAENKKIDKKRK